MPTLTKLYTMQEAARHNTPQDCWVVIDGKVYDVGSYLDEHPGGDDVILATTVIHKKLKVYACLVEPTDSSTLLHNQIILKNPNNARRQQRKHNIR